MKSTKKDCGADTLSRVKVPHIGPRPRSNKPSKSNEKGSERRRVLRAVRKK